MRRSSGRPSELLARFVGELLKRVRVDAMLLRSLRNTNKRLSLGTGRLVHMRAPLETLLSPGLNKVRCVQSEPERSELLWFLARRNQVESHHRRGQIGLVFEGRSGCREEGSEMGRNEEDESPLLLLCAGNVIDRSQRHPRSLVGRKLAENIGQQEEDKPRGREFIASSVSFAPDRINTSTNNNYDKRNGWSHP